MFTLKPRNKYAWIKTIDEANKVGSIYTPGNVSNQYRLATVVAIDDQAPEGSLINAGDVVLCDMIGVVSHRIGMQTIETCLIKNFLGVVVSDSVETSAALDDQKNAEVRRVPRHHSSLTDSVKEEQPLKRES